MSSPASTPTIGPGKLVLFALANIALSAFTSLLVVRALLPPQPGTPLAVLALPTNPPAAGQQTVSAAVPFSDTNSRANGNPEATTAAAMGTVDPLKQPGAAAAPTQAGPAATPTLLAPLAATPPPSGPAASVRISAVVFAGQLSRESVVIVNEGEQVDMNSWTVSTPRGKTYSFGKVTLFKSSFVSLHSTSGADVPTDLFWNQTEPVWQSGDEVKLSKGDQVIATFTVK